MPHDSGTIARHLTRRRTLSLLGGATALSALKGATVSCIPVATQQTEGPYWVEEKLNRSDIRVDPTTGAVSPGVLLTLAINVHEITGSACTALAGAWVDLWHCDAGGIYSDVAANSSVGRKFLRGYQITDDSGAVQFTTIYPGWYSGRTVHIHIRIRTWSGTQVYDVFTAQLFFDDTVTDQVFTQAPYNTRRARDTRNATDMVLTQTNGTTLFLNLTKNTAGYAASVDVGVDLKAITTSAPVISPSGVVSSASFQPGVTPGAWTAIFGQNLAAANRTLAATDLVNGALPKSLGGVTVQINGKAAFPTYVSPTQINVQAPSDTSSGTVGVSVTNAAGTSAAASVLLQTLMPAFFVSGQYAAAVNAAGAIVTTAKSGDVLELFGTGFGPTTPDISAGAAVSAAAPLVNSVAVTIDGVQAPLLFAGLVAAGLYQFNVTVPTLGDGDHAVLAQIAGQTTQAGVLLKTQS